MFPPPPTEIGALYFLFMGNTGTDQRGVSPNGALGQELGFSKYYQSTANANARPLL